MWVCCGCERERKRESESDWRELEVRILNFMEKFEPFLLLWFLSFATYFTAIDSSFE